MSEGAALAVRWHIGIPPTNSTQVGDVAKATGSQGLFALFQAASALLLLAAASSSFQAGPGLLKALARTRAGDGPAVGILPAWMGRTNRHHTPYWGVVIYFFVAAAVVVAAGGRDQELVLFYAVSVFMSFLAGLLAMAKFSRSDDKRFSLLLNGAGAAVVAFTLAVNLRRGDPAVSLAAALLIAAVFYLLWVRAGRPRGVSMVDQIAERELGQEGLPASDVCGQPAKANPSPTAVGAITRSRGNLVLVDEPEGISAPGRAVRRGLTGAIGVQTEVDVEPLRWAERNVAPEQPARPRRDRCDDQAARPRVVSTGARSTAGGERVGRGRRCAEPSVARRPSADGLVRLGANGLARVTAVRLLQSDVTAFERDASDAITRTRQLRRHVRRLRRYDPRPLRHRGAAPRHPALPRLSDSDRA